MNLTLHVMNLHVEAINLSQATVGEPLELKVEPFVEAVAGGLSPQKVLADGTHVAAQDPRTDHVAVFFPDTGWMITAASLGEGKCYDNHDEALKAARDLRLLGHDNWQLAPIAPWERHVIDRSRYEPAVHVDLFPGIVSGWHWTSDECAWSRDEKTGVAASAWFVYSSRGYVDGLPRNLSGFGLAARRVGQ